MPVLIDVTLIYFWTAVVLAVIALMPDIPVPDKKRRLVVWALLWPVRLVHLLILMWRERQKPEG